MTLESETFKFIRKTFIITRGLTQTKTHIQSEVVEADRSNHKRLVYFSVPWFILVSTWERKASFKRLCFIFRRDLKIHCVDSKSPSALKSYIESTDCCELIRGKKTIQYFLPDIVLTLLDLIQWCSPLYQVNRYYTFITFLKKRKEIKVRERC